MGVTRRQFIQLTGASAAGAVAFAACTPAQSEITVPSTARMPEDLVTGIDTWYASICRMCPSGCGIIVRVMEGRAKKIEGNPDYPVNRGKLCARGQAGLQALYHPDRIRGPLRRTGPRGSGQFESISWEAGLEELLNRLKPLSAPGQLGQVTLITEHLRGHLASLVSRLSAVTRGLQWINGPPGEGTVRAALGNLLGQNGRSTSVPLPHFDIANSRFVLSFGADFLSSWVSPVQHGVGYGRFRGRPGNRGTLVQVEPRMTATGASADKWVPIRPGAEGFLALGLAQVMVSEGLASAAAAAEAGLPPALLERYRPQAVAQATDIPQEEIVDLARRFASQTPSLAIGGGVAAAHTNGRFNVEAIYALNRLVGSVAKMGGTFTGPPPPIQFDPDLSMVWRFSHWQALLGAMKTGQPALLGDPPRTIVPPQVLLVRGANPAYELPTTLGFREALDSVPFIASFSSHMDDTTTMADLVLPGHTYLEDWGTDIPDPGPGFQVVGFQQPVVNPFFDSRSFGDILLSLGKELGFGQGLPWNSFRDAVRDGAQELMGLRAGSVQAASFEEYWIHLLQRGGWWNEGVLGAVVPPVGPARALEGTPPRYSGDEQEYPFHLIPFPSASLGAGEGAHLPWLQAMPDPITTAVWMTWVEVNTETARRLQLNMGDVVRVESPAGSLEAPVYAHPGIRPDVVAIPMGQGHAVFGRYAEGRGANVMDLLAPTVSDDGSLAWAATRVRLAKTGTSVRVLRAEGSVTPVEPEDVDIVGVIPG